MQAGAAQVGAAGGSEVPVEYMDALKAASTKEEVLAMIAQAPQETGIGPKVIY